MLELTDVINQMVLIDISRTSSPNTKEYTLYSEAHGASPKIDHILGHKADSNR